MCTDFVKAYQSGLMVSALFILALCVALFATLNLAPLIRDYWRKFRKNDAATKAVAIISVVISVAYGGTKFTPTKGNAGADDGIALAYIYAEYDSTNDVTNVAVAFIGQNVTTATPVSVRNDQTEIWRELEKIAASVTVDLATNLLTFAVSGNVETNKLWWAGTETPAVIIESKGIKITHFAASSRAVEIMWTCDDPNATAFSIQRRRKKFTEWETVGVTTSTAYVYVGFTVGETWEWRVSSNYEAKEGD